MDRGLRQVLFPRLELMVCDILAVATERLLLTTPESWVLGCGH